MKLGVNNEIEFTVTDGIKDLGVKGAFFVVHIDQKEADPNKIELLLKETTQHVRANHIDVKEDAVLTGFRDLHTAVGVSNRKHVSSPENLIGLIQGGRDLPTINPIVDIYNIVSLETKLALGAHDIHKLGGKITLRLTNGTEEFIPLGSPEKKPIGSGEYAYIDEDSNEVICRLETRQCERTKVTDTTQKCFFIVEGNNNTDIDYIEKAIARLKSLLIEYFGAAEIHQIYRLGK